MKNMKDHVLIKLAQELAAQGYIQPEHVKNALAWYKTTGGDFYDYLVEKEYIQEEILAKVLAKKKNLPYVLVEEMEIEPNVVKVVPEKVIKKYFAIPIAKNGRELSVVIANPFDFNAISDIEFASGFIVIPLVAQKSHIKKVIEKFFKQSNDDLAEIMQVVKEEEQSLEVLQTTKEEDRSEVLASAAEEAPIVKLANFIISDAIHKKVSDIHIEPYEDELRVRFRIDGVLHQVLSLSRNIHPGISSRIKIMSEMDISERRKPQDGRMKIKVEKRTIDMRVSSIPTIFGEKIVLRILDESNLVLDLAKLGFEPQELEEFRKSVESPYGMILVTGPTGSGKTTTLYSALDWVNKEGVNIMTAEDPVEYNLKGINQIQIKEKVGLTFANALRSFLRQDPDVILVGEIRDHDTAEIAVKAAQTGHLVLSTLHTNDALSTIDRLINIGIPPFMVVSAVILIIAQRLVRKICPACKEEVSVPRERLASLELTTEELNGFKFFQGKGCKVCNHTGYKGRIGLYEVLPLKEEIKILIAKGAQPPELKNAAAAIGMRTIRETGIVKLREGITTVEEVVRVTTKI
jgi:type IV-A pilus assembly ATPase PilB